MFLLRLKFLSYFYVYANSALFNGALFTGGVFMNGTCLVLVSNFFLILSIRNILRFILF